MVGGFALYKTMARQAVHDQLAVPCVYLAKDGTVLSSELTVRHHTKVGVNPAFEDGYAGIIEGVNRLVFDKAQVAAAGITLKRGNVVRIDSLGVTLELDQPEPDDGPVNLYWSVVEP